MSKEEATRFAKDMVSNKELLNEVKESGGGLSAILSVAKTRGYDFDLDDAKAYLAARAEARMTDAQLGSVAGGKGAATSTSTVQNTVTVSTAAAAAEVAAVVLVAGVIVVT